VKQFIFSFDDKKISKLKNKKNFKILSIFFKCYKNQYCFYFFMRSICERFFEESSAYFV